MSETRVTSETAETPETPTPCATAAKSRLVLPKTTSFSQAVRNRLLRRAEPASVTEPAASTSSVVNVDRPRRRRIAAAAAPPRTWTAVVCGVPGDGTLMIVDWIILAFRNQGIIASAMPIGTANDDGALHGMFIEAAVSVDASADPADESELAGVPHGPVDVVICGEHLELARAVEAGWIGAEQTTVLASCRREWTPAENLVAASHAVREQELDSFVAGHARRYFAFDGPQVAGWYHLPATAQAGLLFGAFAGSSASVITAESCTTAIEQLGIDAGMHCDALTRGLRLGRRQGGRIRRSLTAEQFTRSRRVRVSRESRSGFLALIDRVDETIAPEHREVVRHAVFQAVEFEDATYAKRLLQHVEQIAQAEGDVPASRSLVPDIARSLAAMMVWPDLAWIAERKLRWGRLAQLRAMHQITRRDSYEVREWIPLEAGDKADLVPARIAALRGQGAVPYRASILDPVSIEYIDPTTLRGAMRLKRMRASASRRADSVRQQRELDSVDAYLQSVHDTLGVDHELARLVAQSGSIIQGWGAAREASRATAHAFWGRIVRQSVAIDRAGGDGQREVSHLVVPFVWNQIQHSGPLALWEFAAQVLGIALAHARGVSYEDTVAYAHQLCAPRTMIDGC